MKPIDQSYDYVDRYMQKATGISAKQGNPVSCSAGCFHCCKEPVHALKEEAQHLVDGLKDDAHRERVTAQTRKWWDGFHTSGLHQSPHPQKGDGFTHLLRYRAENLWCPLLENGLCSGYQNRPTSCRFHTAIGSPNKCRVDEERPAQRYMLTAQQNQVEQNALTIVADGATRYLFQIDHLGLWLAHILLGKSERSIAGHDVMAELVYEPTHAQ